MQKRRVSDLTNVTPSCPTHIVSYMSPKYQEPLLDEALKLLSEHSDKIDNIKVSLYRSVFGNQGSFWTPGTSLTALLYMARNRADSDCIVFVVDVTAVIFACNIICPFFTPVPPALRKISVGNFAGKKTACAMVEVTKTLHMYCRRRVLCGNRGLPFSTFRLWSCCLVTRTSQPCTHSCKPCSKGHRRRDGRTSSSRI